MNTNEAYKILQQNCDIKVGDTVKVVRKAKDYEMEWLTPWHLDLNYSIWHTNMNNSIGQEFVVKSISKCGIQLNNECYYPFLVLEVKNKFRDITIDKE